MLRAVLVGDDSAAWVEEVGRTLGVEVVACAADAATATSAIAQARPDRVVLPSTTSAAFALELLSRLGAAGHGAMLPDVVFLPGDHAPRPPGSALAATERLSLCQLVQSLQRVPVTPPLATRVPCLAEHGVRLVDVERIEFANSEGEMTRVVGHFGELNTRLSLRALELKGLWRCHKQYLVNPAAIDQVREGPATVLLTRGGHEVPVGRRFAPRILELIGF